MFPLNLALFYDICNVIKQLNQRQSHYNSLVFLSLFNILKVVTQKVLQ